MTLLFINYCIHCFAALKLTKLFSLPLRYRLLEALRVASLWRQNTSHATPVLPYARLAFAHTLTFLNKVCLSLSKNTLIFTLIYELFSILRNTCVQTDLVHTLGESAALGAAGVVLWGELKFAKSEVCHMLLSKSFISKSHLVVFVSNSILHLLSPASMHHPQKLRPLSPGSVHPVPEV